MFRGNVRKRRSVPISPLTIAKTIATTIATRYDSIATHGTRYAAIAIANALIKILKSILIIVFIKKIKTTYLESILSYQESKSLF